MKKILVLIIIGLLCMSTFSVLAPQVKAQESVIFGDDFESYGVGTFPSAGGWVLVYDGQGAQYQKVIDTVSVSGFQSFQLWGQYMWSACSRRNFSTDATIVGYEVNVRVEDYGTYWLNAFFSLWSDATETDYMQMSFHSDGKIYVYSYVPIWYSGEPPGPMYDLETTYEPDTWYNIRVIVNRETNIFNVWINNVLKGENLQTKDSFALNALRLGSSHAGVPVYYDDVKVFALSPAKLLVMFGYAEYIIDQAWTFPDGTTFTFRGWLQSKGYSVSTVSEAFPTGEITLSGLQEFQALLVFGDFFADPANIPYTDTVLTYLNLGGGLILFGQGSHPAITFDEALGFRWSGSAPGPVDPWSFYVDASITDYSHPVMQGITELPKAGGVFVDWDTLIDETPLPSGTAVLARTIGSGGPYDPIDRIALIAFQYGAGRVVVGPWDGLARPYGPTAVNPWDVISEPVVENKLLPNAINWVARSVRALIVNAKWQDVPSAYYPTISTALEELAIPYDILNPETLTLNTLETYDFVFIPCLGPYIPEEDLLIYNPDIFADMIEQYVINGGSLLFCPGHSVLYGEEVRDPPIFDITYVEGPYIYVDLKVTDTSHPIMQGPYRSFSLNEQIYAHKIDMVSHPDNSQILGVFVDTETGNEYGDGLAVFQRGDGKVVSAGIQIGWTSSGPAIYNGVPSEIWKDLTKNMIDWLLKATINQSPVADFRYRGPRTSFTPSTIYVGSEVKFDAEPSYDLDGPNQNPVSYTWDFGDESDLLTTTEEEASHAYVVSGPYTVTLIVTDDKGVTDVISKDIFINSFGWEIYFEIDYMTGHKPTDSVLEYVHSYFRDNGIYVYFFIDDEISVDPSVTRAEFWALEKQFNDVMLFDDRAEGSEITALTKLAKKEKWVLYGTETDFSWMPDAHGVIFNVPYITDRAANYIFIADQFNDQSALPVTAEQIETVALMHEIGHSIGITLWDWPPWRDQDRDGTPEDYDNDAKSVMARLTLSNCRSEPIGYSHRYWLLKDIEHYEI